jgi:hypothetical protein
MLYCATAAAKLVGIGLGGLEMGGIACDEGIAEVAGNPAEASKGSDSAGRGRLRSSRGSRFIDLTDRYSSSSHGPRLRDPSVANASKRGTTGGKGYPPCWSVPTPTDAGGVGGTVGGPGTTEWDGGGELSLDMLSWAANLDKLAMRDLISSGSSS